METRQIHVRDLSTVTGIQQYEHCVQSIFFLGLEDFEGTIYLSLESDKFSEDVALTNNTFIIGQPMTKFNVTYTCQIYGIVGTGEKIQLSKQFRMAVYKSNNISGEAGEYPIDPNLVNGIDQYITGKESQIDDYVEQVIESIPSDYSTLEQATYNAYPTQSETGNPIYFDDGADDIPVKELIVNLEPKQSGSGDPSPSNVRPISGYDGVTVKRTGKNLLENGASFDRTVYGITKETLADGSVHIYGTNTSTSASAWFGLGTFSAEQGARYWYGGFPKDMSDTTYFVTRYGSAGNTYADSSYYTFASDVEATPRFYVRPNVTVDVTFTPTVSNGEHVNTYTIDLNGTVYGGVLNVTTGVLTVTHGIVTDFSALASNGTSSTGAYRYRLNVAGIPSSDIRGLMCNMLKYNRQFNADIGEFYNATDVLNIFLADSTVASAITTLTGCQIVYPLVTPTTVQLTPTEVSTLLGYNTISSDGSMELQYRADTTMVIEKLTNAIISLGGNV